MVSSCKCPCKLMIHRGVSSLLLFWLQPLRRLSAEDTPGPSAGEWTGNPPPPPTANSSQATPTLTTHQHPRGEKLPRRPIHESRGSRRHIGDVQSRRSRADANRRRTDSTRGQRRYARGSRHTNTHTLRRLILIYSLKRPPPVCVCLAL